MGISSAKCSKMQKKKIERTERLKREGWNLQKIISSVSQQFGIEKSELKRKRRNNKVSDAKKAVLYVANKELKISGRELSEYFCISRQAVTQGVNAGESIVEKYEIKLV